ncbi:MAG TPA: DUF1707 domain-containing protein [Chloroflexota bacterium]|nr:DUF1707 domain-containing protein [Chloroflexota bacterium]
MADQRPDALRVSDAERQQTSRRLQGACVEGYLTLEDFSLRVERALAAQTRGELAELTQDLPTRPASTTSRQVLDRPASTLVVLSGVERTGLWRIAETSALLVVLGNCKLDLRRATIAASLTTIHVRVVFGSLEVIVPHGVEVELEASSVLSSKTLRVTGPNPVGDPPRIVISGVVVGGSLTVRDSSAGHDWRA